MKMMKDRIEKQNKELKLRKKIHITVMNLMNFCVNITAKGFRF